MSKISAALAQSITWSGSKQSYYTARLLVDRDLVDDCYRAYAYFRWADDIVDDSSQSREMRISFIERQKDIIDRLYINEYPDDLTPEERIIADLISHDRGENSGLQSFIRNFLAVIEFDAYRKGRIISQDELDWYSGALGKSVTDAIQYFIGNETEYPVSEYHYLAATAAHITHMLRDMKSDIIEGYINIPQEYLDGNSISPKEMDSPFFRAWVRERVELARGYFFNGKVYLDGLDVLRCKLAGYWYCARFEGILDKIERNNFQINTTVYQKRKVTSWFKMALLGIRITIRHTICRSDHDHCLNNAPKMTGNDLGAIENKQEEVQINEYRNSGIT